MTTPKISVIVPVYKVEPYLDGCIKCIVNQTYKNLEIILVDDGSPDKCPQICDEWQKRDNRILVIHKTNGGLSDARNFGLDRASGDFISFIDSDDLVTDDYIETLYNLCVAHECDIASCDVAMVNDYEIIPCANEDNVRVFSNTEMLCNLYNELGVATVIACNKLFRKRLFENIRFRVGMRHEDELSIPPIIYSANKIAVSSKRMYMYYLRTDSITGSPFSRENLDIAIALEERIRFFDAHGLNDLKEIAIEEYCVKLIVLYNKSRRYIRDCHDVLKELMLKYKRTYKKILFQKRLLKRYRIRFVFYRFSPRLSAWLWKGWAS